MNLPTDSRTIGGEGLPVASAAPCFHPSELYLPGG